MNYTDVTPIQLFGGWILAGIFAVSFALLFRCFCASNRAVRFWFKEWTRDWAELDTANDKVKSLEAQISRLISRPRGKNGRFERVKKV